MITNWRSCFGLLPRAAEECSDFVEYRATPSLKITDSGWREFRNGREKEMRQLYEKAEI